MPGPAVDAGVIPAAAGRMNGMTESWVTMRVADVRPGDRVRLASGKEMLVSRIEPEFMGTEGMIAFVEDTPARWFKQPFRQTTEVEVSRET